MADQVKNAIQGQMLPRLFRDNGDGTFSEVIGFPDDAAITLTGDIVVDTLGALNDAKETNPSAPSATIPSLLRGLLDTGYSAAATFTPAAASHVAGDCIGAAAEIDFGAPVGRPIKINSCSLAINGPTAEVSTWRLYLYSITPPSAYADDTPWDLLTGDRASFLGYIDLGTAIDLGGTQWVETHNINKQIKLAGDSVFAYLVNGTTLTPAAVAHVVTLHAVKA